MFDTALSTQQDLPNEKAQSADLGKDRLRHMIDHKELYPEETQKTIDQLLKQVPAGENNPVEYLRKDESLELWNCTDFNHCAPKLPLTLIQDLTPLSELTQLKSLWLHGNNIQDITPLAKLTQLTDLSLSHNRIQDLTPLAYLTCLEELDLSNNQIQDLISLAGLTRLEKLWLSINKIQNIKPLAGLTRLKTLHLSGNQIEDLEPLSGLIHLEWLSLGYNPIKGLTTLADMTQELILIFDTDQIARPDWCILPRNIHVHDEYFIEHLIWPPCLKQK